MEDNVAGRRIQGDKYSTNVESFLWRVENRFYTLCVQSLGWRALNGALPTLYNFKKEKKKKEKQVDLVDEEILNDQNF